MTATFKELETQLERNRAELAATIDELTDRLDPRVAVEGVVARAKKLVHDAGTDPSTSGADRGKARRILGLGAGGAAAAVALIIALARRP